MIRKILFVLFLSVTSFAYIPQSEYILEQVVKNAGKGSFSIENEVTFRSPQETITVHERWWIQDAMTMRLSATGPGINIQYAYRDNKTEYVNDAGKNVARKTPPEMLERFFFSRQLKTLSDLLVSARILGHSPKPQPKFLKIKDITNCYGMTETSPVSFQTSSSDSFINKTTSVGTILEGL
jgi:hypothetical protein